MLKFRAKNKLGAETNPQVVAIMILIGIILASVVVAVVLPMINRSKDTKVMEDVKSLSTAVGVYIADTNGEAPCFDPTLKEGSDSAAVAASGLCAQGGKTYNFLQGGTSPADTDLDNDGVMGEFMTPQSILGGKYVSQIPSQAYDGEPYYYTKGLNTNSNFSQTYAVSGLLKSDVADREVTGNTSILDAISTSNDAVAFTDSTTTKSCRATDIAGNGLMASHATGANGATVASELGGWKYYGVTSLTATTFKAADKSCDIFSAGHFVQNAFGGTAGASPTITINAK